MESCVMEPAKLIVDIWGFSISADGRVAIAAAVIIVFLVVWRCF